MSNLPPIDNAEIDALLDKFRPDRYSAEDHDWRSPVVRAVAKRMPPQRAAVIAAEHVVGQREGQATRAVNRLLRKVADELQWPLPGTYDDLLRKPLSIDGQRVCLEAATADDLERWAIAERREAAQDFTSRSQACDGAEWLAKTMRDKGWMLFADGNPPDTSGVAS